MVPHRDRAPGGLKVGFFTMKNNWKERGESFVANK